LLKDISFSQKNVNWPDTLDELTSLVKDILSMLKIDKQDLPDD